MVYLKTGMNETYVAPAKNIFKTFALVKHDNTTKKVMFEMMITMILCFVCFNALQMIIEINKSNIIIKNIKIRTNVIIKKPKKM